jgi:mono/diheme cytochrome c family protein
MDWNFTMKSIAGRAVVLLLALLFSTGALTMAQQSQTTIKNGPIQKTSAPSGEDLFNTYCAVCHGKDAKGNGPAAGAFKVPPPDLTTLAQHHGGKFPTEYVTAVLQYGVEGVKAHGSKDMPVWGPLLGPSGALRQSPSLPLAEEREVSSLVTLKIHNLSQYIESLQAK